MTCRPKRKEGLRFKELGKFNIELLVKQGLRLISKPDCLLARVMKAKYYAHTDFMNATLGSYPLYTWHSVWTARRLLEQGCGW